MKKTKFFSPAGALRELALVDVRVARVAEDDGEETGDIDALVPALDADGDARVAALEARGNGLAQARGRGAAHDLRGDAGFKRSLKQRLSAKRFPRSRSLKIASVAPQMP